MSYAPRDWASHPPYLSPAYRSTVLRAPGKPLVPMPQTLSEITGPVYGHESVGPLDHDLTRNAVVNGAPLGERIVVTGRVLDEAGRPVPDALIEIWQANAAGRYVHRWDQHDAPLDPNFYGGGRCVTDSEGRYAFKTIRPVPYTGRPPHLHIKVLPKDGPPLTTQIYIAGDAVDRDPVLRSSPAGTLALLSMALAPASGRETGALEGTFDFVLRQA